MSLVLKMMTFGEIEDFRILQAEKYAASLMKAGVYETYDLALESASSQLNTILKSNQEVHSFSWVKNNTSNDVLGVLWWAFRTQGNSVWIYDIEIYETYRRKGYASLALRELERLCLDQGVHNIALNVFAYNVGAEKLYRDLGFVDVSKHMRKDLKRHQ